MGTLAEGGIVEEFDGVEDDGTSSGAGVGGDVVEAASMAVDARPQKWASSAQEVNALRSKMAALSSRGERALHKRRTHSAPKVNSPTFRGERRQPQR